VIERRYGNAREMVQQPLGEFLHRCPAMEDEVVAIPPFWLLAPDFLDFHIPQGYQGEALSS
jgi:hypothetical protein